MLRANPWRDKNASSRIGAEQAGVVGTRGSVYLRKVLLHLQPLTVVLRGWEHPSESSEFRGRGHWPVGFVDLRQKLSQTLASSSALQAPFEAWRLRFLRRLYSVPKMQDDRGCLLKRVCLQPGCSKFACQPVSLTRPATFPSA